MTTSVAWDLPVPRHRFFKLREAHAALAPRSIGQMANPFEFIQDVRQEASKVTWPNRRETAITTVLVMIMCVLASAFLAITDQLIHLGINLILGFGR